VEQPPVQVGPWRLASTQPLDPQTAAQLRGAVGVVAAYVHHATSQSVQCVFLVGPTAALCVHRPEVCYPAETFRQCEPRRRVAVNGAFDDRFWAVTFADEAEPSHLRRVYYGFGDGHQWRAPAAPRLIRRRYVYRLQTACDVLQSGAENADDACGDFLRHYVPATGSYLKPLPHD
jgi:hypothetical protein